MHQFDFLIIGSGPAGQRAAIQAAKLGKRVALVERDAEVGGVSLHTGTIPSKTLREAVLYLTGWDQRGLYGRGYRLKKNLTIDDLMQRLHVTLKHETEVIENQLFRNVITVFTGLMLAIFIAALNQTIIAPALPTIGAENIAPPGIGKSPIIAGAALATHLGGKNDSSDDTIDFTNPIDS